MAHGKNMDKIDKKMDKMDKKMAGKTPAKGAKPMSPKDKKLAAMSGDKSKITRGDVIKGAQMKKSGSMKAKKK